MSDLNWTTEITKIKPDEIRLRGYRIDELMGNVTFPEAVYLALKGELPGKEIGELINAILVSSIDHGATPPSVLAARTIASTGAPLNAAVAGGILAVSRWHGGAIEMCMQHLIEIKRMMGEENLDEVQATRKLVSAYRAQKKRLSGFGHRIHKKDPRTKTLFDLAEKAKLNGNFISIARSLSGAIKEILGRELPINVDGAIAALLCELDFPPEVANGFFMMARVPGLIAHIFEEQSNQKPMRKIHPTDHNYKGPEDRTL